MTIPTSQIDASAALAAAPLGEDDLHALMQSVSETTRQLEQTHVALHREVARLKQELADANAQLRRSESLAALGQMAAGIAHEIRNPLGCIQLYAQALSEDVRNEPAQLSLCAKINHAVTTLDAIVRDVLLFSREIRIERSAMCAAGLIAQAIGHCDALLAKTRIEIDRTGVVPLPLLGDGNLLNQALGNVMRNAIEAMAEHERPSHRLTLATSQKRMLDAAGVSGEFIVLAVRDTGPGIPDDVRERMFNPFFTTRSVGTGLGLAIVHRIIEAHGGQVRVHVHDEQDGRGTTFELCLPTADESAEIAKADDTDDDDEPALIIVETKQTGSLQPISQHNPGARMSRAARVPSPVCIGIGVPAMETHR